MQPINLRPLKHILVCTNEREQGKSCCPHVQWQETYRELKDFVKEKDLRSTI